MNRPRRMSVGGVFGSKLAKRQLFFILVFSSMITLFGTLFQLFIEYRTDVGFIQEQFRQIRQAHLDSLTWSLWNFDSAQINTQIKSILSLRDIVHIEIQEKGKVLYNAGDVDAKSTIKSTQYEMIYDHRGAKKLIGTVKATASFEGPIQRMRNRILIILGTQGLKTFCVSFFILYIINRLVIRHLGTISEYTKKLQSETLDRRLELDRPSSSKTRNDELDQIVASLNDMRERLMDDISKIKRTEEALVKSEERFRMAFDADAIGRTLTGIDGSLLHTNRSLIDMLGYSSEEFKRLSFIDITFKEDIAASKECMRCLLAKEQDTYHLEKRYVRKDGSVLWADVSTVLLFDEAGKPLHFITGIQDISERKENQQKISDALEFNETIISESPIGISIYDGFGQCLAVNDAIINIIGATKEQALAQNFNDIESWRVSGLLDKAAKALKENVTQRQELKTVSTFEKTVSLDCHLAPFTAEGQPRLLLMANDITDRMQAEEELARHREHLEELVEERTAQLEQEIDERRKIERQIAASLAEKEVLLREIHHRVKNNLNTVSNLLYLQSRTLADPRTRGAFRESRNRIQTMARVHELLHRSDTLAHIDMNAYLKELTSDLAESFPHRPALLDTGASGVTLEIDRAIPCGLIVTELVSNSLKYAFTTEKQEDRISVELSAQGGGCRLVVADNGVGLPEGFNIEQARSLGLRLVEMLTRQLHGSLEINSVPGQGTRFSVAFKAIEPGKEMDQ